MSKSRHVTPELEKEVLEMHGLWLASNGLLVSLSNSSFPDNRCAEVRLQEGDYAVTLEVWEDSTEFDAAPHATAAREFFDAHPEEEADD